MQKRRAVWVLLTTGTMPGLCDHGIGSCSHYLELSGIILRRSPPQYCLRHDQMGSRVRL